MTASAAARTVAINESACCTHEDTRSATLPCDGYV